MSSAAPPSTAEDQVAGRSAEPSPAKRTLALARTLPWLPVAVAGIALLELVFHFVFARRAPRPEQWAKARPVVESWYQPGDVVSIAPYWAEPMARWQFGDRLMPLADVARPDVSRYARAIEVSAMGQHDSELKGWIVERQTSVGPLDIRCLRQPAPASVRYVFIDHLQPPDADVFMGTSERPTPCAYTKSAPVQAGGLSGNPTFPAERFSCGGGVQFAGITVIDDERNRPRRCIWTYPSGGSQEVVLRFANVPLGSVIQGHTGAHWMFERETVTGYTIRVVIGGEEVGRVVHQGGKDWTPFRLQLHSDRAGHNENVEFHLSATSGRPACFEADTR